MDFTETSCTYNSIPTPFHIWVFWLLLGINIPAIYGLFQGRSVPLLFVIQGECTVPRKFEFGPSFELSALLVWPEMTVVGGDVLAFRAEEVFVRYDSVRTAEGALCYMV